jgi:hypothetical protein
VTYRRPFPQPITPQSGQPTPLDSVSIDTTTRVGSHFAQQIPLSFRPKLTRLPAFTKEAIVDETAQAAAVLDTRAEV